MKNHFGDIMSHRETMNIVNGNYSPLERIVLTANGNLQRILSAYFNTTVTVHILKNELITQEPLSFDRKVELECFGVIKCVAESIISITDPTITELITSKKVGLGQLFRYLNILPEFTLLHVDRNSSHFWRSYRLECKGIVCEIKETFPVDLFDGPYIHQPIKLDQVNTTSTFQAPN